MLTRCVLPILYQDNVSLLRDIQPNVRRAIASTDHAIVDRFLDYASIFLGIEKGEALQDRDGFREWIRPVSAQDKQNGLALTPRMDEILMELLTGAWLGLYFLGVPFIHPWERVRRMADASGGYPSGGCISKVIGDVYRTARRINRVFGVETVDPESQSDLNQHATVLVLTRRPLLLVKNLIETKMETLTPQALHVLGHCYELLQLRLYVNAGLPVKYFVPWRALRRAADLGGGEITKTCEETSAWLKTVLPPGTSGQEVTLVKDERATAGVPACVLGYQTGMYMLDTIEPRGSSESIPDTPFAGNRIGHTLLASYRDRLSALAGDNLVGLDGGSLAALLRENTAAGI